MPPPNVFKAYNKAMGKDFEKVEISESPKKCESTENDVVEIDKTNNEKEKVKSNYTVTESEMEIEHPSSKKGGRPPKKNKGRGRPSKSSKNKGGGRPNKEEEMEEQSKWPKPLDMTSRCYIDGVVHQGGCAAYIVNHKMEILMNGANTVTHG
uniref:Uncharacterized protein n=1 Tax=Panagrolaimus sp. PS1159 TaxID=55785 RepID=A0AC35FH12_9BILA